MSDNDSKLNEICFVTEYLICKIIIHKTLKECRNLLSKKFAHTLESLKLQNDISSDR